MSHKILLYNISVLTTVFRQNTFLLSKALIFLYTDFYIFCISRFALIFQRVCFVLRSYSDNFIVSTCERDIDGHTLYLNIIIYI